MISHSYRIGIIMAIAGIAMLGLWLSGPIAQDPDYHQFADQHSCAGLPNFWNLVSNLPFLLVGIFALWRVPRLAQPECQPAYGLMSLGILLVSLGSAYYHYAPSNQSLLWDRVPITIAFMALFALILNERVRVGDKNRILLGLVGYGIGACFYWSWTETQGVGDLRPYLLAQFLPLLLIPVILLIFRQQYLSSSRLLQAFGWYLVAKLLELYDQPLYDLLGGVSGHPLKHLAAAIAALCLVRAVPVQALQRKRA